MGVVKLIYTCVSNGRGIGKVQATNLLGFESMDYIFSLKNVFFLYSLNQLFAEIRKHSVDTQNELGKTILD